MSFELPAIYENVGGWGPPKTEEGLPFDIPYQPFYKSDRISRIAEWIPDSKLRGGRGRGRGYGGREYYRREEEAADEEDKSWTTTDYHKQTSRFRGFRGRRGGKGGYQPRSGTQGVRRGGGRGAAAPGKQKRRFGARDTGYRRRDIHKTASIEVKQSWDLKSTIAQADLGKLMAEYQHATPAAGQTLSTNGKAYCFNPFFETRVSPQNPVDIFRTNKVLDECSVTQSKSIREIVGGKKLSGVQIYATDMVLATLMAAPKAVNPWDITIQRVGEAYFFDWRKGSVVDMWTVCETAQEQPPLEEPQNANEEQKLNTMPKLMRELTELNLNFSQQILDTKKVVKKQVAAAPLPEECESGNKEPASVIYKYTKWELPGKKQSDPAINLVARTHVDGYADQSGSKTFRAFSMLDHQGGDWTKRIPNAIGAVTASEMKDNGCRMVRQVAVSMLAMADVMKVGFVQRKRTDCATAHQLIHVAQHVPRVFASQFSVSYRGMWNILIKIIHEIIEAQNPNMNVQKFVLVKDPNKAIIKLYETTNDGSDDEDDDEDEEDEEDEEEEESDDEE